MYEWNASLETGYESIDQQHMQLFEALNDITAASRQGRGNEEVFRTVEFLTGYTILHFATEEKLMVQHAYPDYLTHKQYHDEFKVIVGGLTRQLSDNGSSDELIYKLNSILGDWLLNHIKGDDFRMAAYIKANEAAEKK